MIKILKNNIFTNPPHLYKEVAFDLKDFDSVYENWNDKNHANWKKFLKKYHLRLLDKIEDTKTYNYTGDEKIIGFLFFKDRADKRYIEINFKNVSREYKANSLLITRKDLILSFSKIENILPYKPFLVVGFDKLFLKTIDKFL